MLESTMLNDHEKRITRLEQGQEEIKQQMTELSKQVSDGNAKTEKDNQYLREQNDKMFRELIGLNHSVQERKHQLKLIDKQNFWKVVLALAGSIGVIQAIFEYLTK